MPKEKEREDGETSRRDLIKGAGLLLGSTALGSTGLIAATPASQAPAIGPGTQKCTFPGNSFNSYPPREGKAAFIAEPIPPGAINETVDCDVVVVGAGFFGVCAAASALDGGARVAMLDKLPRGRSDGGDIAVLGDSVHKEAGCLIDPDDVVRELMSSSTYRVEARLIEMWARKSAEALNWVAAIAATAGIKPPAMGWPGLTGPVVEGWGQKVYPTQVRFEGGNAVLVPAIANYVKSKGADVRYNTPGIQLLRPDKTGPITGVIAKKQDGTYIKFNTGKAVILATGGYENNWARLQKYCRPSDIASYQWTSTTTGSTGDGHEMGLAIGAWEDNAPHTILHNPGGILGKVQWNAFAVSPLLRVNSAGERFINEWLPNQSLANAIASQAGAFCWLLLDANAGESLRKMAGPETMGGAAGQVASLSVLPDLVKAGNAIKADTLDELARGMKVPAATLKATVERYNGFVATGTDLDFQKDAKHLTAFAKPPFYAVKEGTLAMTTVSGLKINANAQVLDVQGKVIAGLYAGGNVSGGMFNNAYPHQVNGISLGRCMTFGYIAGRHATTGKV